MPDAAEGVVANDVSLRADGASGRETRARDVDRIEHAVSQ